MKLKPLKGMPIASATGEDGRLFLVAGDFHLGLSNRMGVGRPLPEEEASEICGRISLAGRITGARNLIILGDLKHGLFEPNSHEKRALRKTTEELAKKFDVWVVKGNHDYDIEMSIDSRVKVVGKGGLELDRTVFIHGHSLPRLSDKLESYDMIVSGHIHPQLLLAGEWKPVWLILQNRTKGRPKKVVILPHFSLYASRAGYRPGPPVNIAPFLTRLDISHYDYHMKDLSLNDLATGKASAIISMN